LCKSADETVTHILAECPKIAQTEYLKRHNAVAAVVHKIICDGYATNKHGSITQRQWQKQKILWDFKIRTDKVNPGKIPVDVTVPSDAYIKDKLQETEKLTKYQSLKIELHRMWIVECEIKHYPCGSRSTNCNIRLWDRKTPRQHPRIKP
jgi:hypothetical protein